MSDKYRKDPNQPHSLDGRVLVSWNRTENKDGFAVSRLLAAGEIEAESISDKAIASPKVASDRYKTFKPRLAKAVGAAIGQTVRLWVAGRPGVYMDFTNASEQTHIYQFHGCLGDLNAAQYDWLHVQFLVDKGLCSHVELTLIEDRNKYPHSDLEFREEHSTLISDMNVEIAWYLIHTTLERMLRESFDSRDRGFGDEDGTGSFHTRARTTDFEESTVISWKCWEDGSLTFMGFAGGPFPEVLTEHQREALVDVGWQLPEDPREVPCTLDIDEGKHDFTEIAHKLVLTLRSIYGVKADWVWQFSPHDLAVDVFEPDCDDILVMIGEHKSRNIHDVVSEEFSFLERFEIPLWLRPWN